MTTRFQAWTMGLLIGATSLACAPWMSIAIASDTDAQPLYNKQRVSEAFDRWAGGGSDVFGKLLSPDVVWTIAGSGTTAGVYRGLDDFNTRAVQPFVSRLRTPLRPIATQVWADGDHVIIHWTGEAVARDGQRYRNDYAWIFRMQGGQAVEVTAFLDLAPYEDVIRRIPGAPDSAEAR
ncbi:nuclear transport factor 2 family protein [Luteimonas sp. RIT-PG2_3]